MKEKIKKKSIKELFTFWPNDTRLGKKKRKKLKEDRVYNKQNEIIFEKLANLSNFPIVKEFIDSSFEDVYKNYYITGNNPFPRELYDDSKDPNTFEKSMEKFESDYKKRYEYIVRNNFFGKDEEETAQYKETAIDNKRNEGVNFDSSSEDVDHNFRYDGKWQILRSDFSKMSNNDDSEKFSNDNCSRNIFFNDGNC